MVVDYCIELFSVLKKLEQSILQIDNLKKTFEHKIERRIYYQSVLVATVISLCAMFWGLSKYSKILGNSVVQVSELESFMRMFAITFVTWCLGALLTTGLNSLWKKDYLPGGKRMISKFLMPKFKKEQKNIAQKAEEYLQNEMFINSKIPAKYLNTETLSYIIKVLQNHEVDSIEAAINLIELEARDDKVRELLIPKENLIVRVKKAMCEDLQIPKIKKQIIGTNRKGFL
ncbi:hypothetical protein ACFO26_03690 [Lactococcus nasutitermitis]|uniref:Uncharacterized protein n=1 Tax=Lactococcus nasutitermitis TaxID=1652957 RepID=A0ABV9JF35_9LACT|nr:hypothetical protein [Lactococcus nasutitermitis]